ncbi:MAG: hypothetical protein WAT39_17795 [Planctomycetota bacterium]
MRTVLFVTAFLVAVPVRQDPVASKEPPLQLTVEVDGAPHTATDGQDLTFTIAGKPVKVKVTVAPTRRFRAAGVEFDFPRDMGFAHDADANLETWTLDGDDVTVMLYRFPTGEAAEMTQSTLVGMIESLDAKAKEPEPCTLALGGKEHAGLRSRVTIGEAATLDTIAVGIARGEGCLLLMVQDSLDDDGKRSAQCAAVLELLAKTFVLGAK